MMKKLWNKLDSIICSYIGITAEEITPNCLNKIGNYFLISNTETFKRHLHVQKLEDFFSTNFNKLNHANKQKLGLAIGKALAKNLIISFDNINITREKFNV